MPWYLYFVYSTWLPLAWLAIKLYYHWQVLVRQDLHYWNSRREQWRLAAVSFVSVGQQVYWWVFGIDWAQGDGLTLVVLISLPLVLAVLCGIVYALVDNDYMTGPLNRRFFRLALTEGFGNRLIAAHNQKNPDRPLPIPTPFVPIEGPLKKDSWKIFSQTEYEFVPSLVFARALAADPVQAADLLHNQLSGLLHKLPEGYRTRICLHCLALWPYDFRASNRNRCPACGEEDSFAYVFENFHAVYTEEAPAVLYDVPARTVRVNLAHEQVWGARHLPFSAVVLDLAAIPNPDHLLNRLLTHFHALEKQPARIEWQLTGLDALGENTRRVLAERVPGVT